LPTYFRIDDNQVDQSGSNIMFSIVPSENEIPTTPIKIPITTTNNNNNNNEKRILLDVARNTIYQKYFECEPENLNSKLSKRFSKSMPSVNEETLNINETEFSTRSYRDKILNKNFKVNLPNSGNKNGLY
jgi:hypothetical protein